MFKRTVSPSFLFVVLFLCLGVIYAAPERVVGYSGLGEHHCKNYPMDLIYRTASGKLAEIFGQKFVDYDSYIRQYVGKDNQDNQYYENLSEDDEDQSNQQATDDEKEILPTVDPIVEEYLQGINECDLGWDSTHVYSIWRFIRFVLNSDYLNEWIRAKMRTSFGYEIQKPNAWMDGEQKTERLRLQKLYSNDYLDNMEDTFFRQYLFPIMTALKSNTAVAVSGGFTKSKQPLLFSILESRNFKPQIFSEVELIIHNKPVLAVTIPGVPLLLTGSSQSISWAFTGISIDRTNVEFAETTGMKYFHQQTQRWIKVKNITSTIKVKGGEDHLHHFYWCEYGTFVQKGLDKTKIKEFVVRWHEDQPKVRLLFTYIDQLISDPTATPDFRFPFNSLLYINGTGIHQVICPPEHASYFIYPDLLGEPRQQKILRASNPKRGFWIVSNNHLSAIKPDGYLEREIFSSNQEVLTDIVRRWKQNKIGLEDGLRIIKNQGHDPNIKKLLELFQYVYRKSKFTYLMDEQTRKQCDQLVALLDKWDFSINSQKHSAVFRLWLYYTKYFTFNHLTKSPLGKYLARYRLTTDTYFANQVALWKQITSYGQCDSHEYKDIEGLVNHTGHNCTCYFSIFRGINATRLLLKNHKGLLETDLSNFKRVVQWDLLRDEHPDYASMYSDLDLAFDNSYSQNIVWATQLSKSTIYSTNSKSPQTWEPFKLKEIEIQTDL